MLVHSQVDKWRVCFKICKESGRVDCFKCGKITVSQTNGQTLTEDVQTATAGNHTLITLNSYQFETECPKLELCSSSVGRAVYCRPLVHSSIKQYPGTWLGIAVTPFCFLQNICQSGVVRRHKKQLTLYIVREYQMF